MIRITEAFEVFILYFRLGNEDQSVWFVCLSAL